MRAIGLERDSSDSVAAIIRATRNGADWRFLLHEVYPHRALTLRGSQAAPQRYQPFLLNLAVQGRRDPSWLFTYVDEFESISQR
ncbi:Branched-chain amino acid aminotransferase II [Penicillium lagena]|uniref:Branched-chain amino acid aminotransferase II n=1 Tax=Penicillium lagena TaxID=94218 RepID=UPI00254218F5|nr:Branched-chain amino acid aminotransferase II [Penicillium lagena]KAJ5623858.1 Branched-chain amino acid aminotransferase II [Penicillium lagena]